MDSRREATSSSSCAEKVNRCGSGAKQRRQDKHRAYMNAVFEAKRQAAFMELMNSNFQPSDHKLYSEKVHDAMVGKDEKRSREEFSVEIDAKINQIRLSDPLLNKQNIPVSDVVEVDRPSCSVSSVQSVYASVLPYANEGCYFVPKDIVNSEVVSVNSQSELVDNSFHLPTEAIDSRDSLENEQLSVTPEVDTTEVALADQVFAPKSPEYSPDDIKPVDQLIEEKECNVIVCKEHPLKVKRVECHTPLFIHKNKYTVIVYTVQKLKGALDLDDFLHSLPLIYRLQPRRRIFEQIPTHGFVFTTSKLSDVIALKRLGFPVIAHLYPDAICSSFMIKQLSYKRLMKFGVTIFFSLNNINSDISSCQDMFCLLKHRGRY